MRSMRPIAAARRVLAASAVAVTLAIGIGANAPIASAGIPGCTWQSLTLMNGWQSEQNAFGTGDPSYCATSDGMVYLSGSLAAPNGASSDEFAVLPSYDAPAHLDYLNVYTLLGRWSVQLSMNAPIAATSSSTEVNELRGRPGIASDAWVSGLGNCSRPADYAEPGKRPR